MPHRRRCRPSARRASSARVASPLARWQARDGDGGHEPRLHDGADGGAGRAAAAALLDGTRDRAAIRADFAEDRGGLSPEELDANLEALGSPPPVHRGKGSDRSEDAVLADMREQLGVEQQHEQAALDSAAWRRTSRKTGEPARSPW